MGEFEPFVASLKRRLQSPLPGHEAHAEMAPYPRRTDASVISVEGKTGREAAVLVLLYPRTGTPTVVLTARQPSLRDHSGQVSFPGGRIEPGESPEAAALREGWEEVGLDRRAATVLGRLTPMYIPPSRFSVVPVVAAASVPPSFVVQEAEVAEIIEVPLAQLLQATTRQRAPRDLGGTRVEVPFWAVGAHQVWGATAMMLAEFVAVVASLKGE